MAEPEQIIHYIEKFFSTTAKKGELKGKKALVTAGPTYEPIDPVRFIGNHSSGKMGIAIAKELHERGAEVSLIIGPVTTEFSANGIHLIRVTTAEEMYQACHKLFGKADLAIMFCCRCRLYSRGKRKAEDQEEGRSFQAGTN